MPESRPTLAIAGQAAVALVVLLAMSARAESVPGTPRIVHGVLTAEYPSTGALLSPGNPGTASLVCSGTLIGCRTFLTAAHCVCDSDGPDCQGVRAPDSSRYLVFLQHGGIFAVSSIAVHPDYSFPVADVAVITLSTPVTGISPSPINLRQTPSLATDGTIVGFGRSGGARVDYGLKRVGRVSTASCTTGISNTTSVCWDFVGPLAPPGEESNTCNGDSGGPLFIDFGCGDTLAGTTSGGTNDICLTTDHSYDANVYLYRSYIQAEAGADLDSAFCGDMPQAGDANTSIIAGSGTLDAETPQGVHSFSVPIGTSRVRVAMNAVDDAVSDFNLYVKQGAVPTATDYDCSQTGPSQFGFCEFSNPAPGTWYGLIDRVSGSGIYQATVTLYGSGSPGPGTDGQSCDDGNVCTGSDACQHGSCSGAPVADGLACDDQSRCTSLDTCVAGTCAGTAAPLSGCKSPFVGGKGSLLMQDTTPDRHDKLVWKWVKGTATTLTQLGDPTTGSGYTFCVFDETANVPALVLETSIPGGPGWTALAAGYSYKDKASSRGGIDAVALKTGVDGRAAIRIKAQGENLAMPVLPLHQDGKVIVQLINQSTCWEARYSTSFDNQASRFRATAD